MAETTTVTESSAITTGDQKPSIASKADRLMACAIWNLAESDNADFASCDKTKTKEARDYYRRRSVRLSDQGADLLDQAYIARSQPER